MEQGEEAFELTRPPLPAAEARAALNPLRGTGACGESAKALLHGCCGESAVRLLERRPTWETSTAVELRSFAAEGGENGMAAAVALTGPPTPRRGALA